MLGFVREIRRIPDAKPINNNHVRSISGAWSKGVDEDEVGRMNTSFIQDVEFSVPAFSVLEEEFSVPAAVLAVPAVEVLLSTVFDIFDMLSGKRDTKKAKMTAELNLMILKWFRHYVITKKRTPPKQVITIVDLRPSTITHKFKKMTKT